MKRYIPGQLIVGMSTFGVPTVLGIVIATYDDTGYTVLWNGSGLGLLHYAPGGEFGSLSRKYTRALE